MLESLLDKGYLTAVVSLSGVQQREMWNLPVMSKPISFHRVRILRRTAAEIVILKR